MHFKPLDIFCLIYNTGRGHLLFRMNLDAIKKIIQINSLFTKIGRNFEISQCLL